jgi:CDP-diacylglycerol--glycerol-3-phosphate 3-phosphatidyltransferase
VWIAAAITDFLDGYMARKLNISSKFGAFLDPVADKLMVSTALVMLTASFGTVTAAGVPSFATALGSVWFSLPVAIVMGREIAVSALREWMAERGARSTVKVGNIGKVKTITQMVAISILLLVVPMGSGAGAAIPYFSNNPEALLGVGMGTLYVSTALAVISGLQYFAGAWQVLIS